MAGLWTSAPVLQADETWIYHVVVQHPGAVVFMFQTMELRRWCCLCSCGVCGSRRQKRGMRVKGEEEWPVKAGERRNKRGGVDWW